MPLDPDLAAWLTLSQISGLGNENLRRLLQVFGTPSLILNASATTLKQVVRPSISNAIVNQSSDEYLSLTSRWLEDPINHIVTLGDSDYPQTLLNIADPPLVLYVKGRLDLLNHSSLAIVGSRNASAQGIRNAESFAQFISEAGLTIVSGMAHGVDTAAHIGGLQGKGSSLAVVGTGLDKVYPSANRDLAHQLAEQGTILSEFSLGTPPLAHNFPRRNRIISGLSLGCLVVEASLQSGSLITARMALEQSREVFAIPGSIHMPQAKGCHSLIKQGAKLVESPSDILEELSWFSSIHKSTEQTQVEHPLYLHLGFDPIDLDSLCQRSGLTIEDLSAILLQLELDGQVTTLAGGMYQRIV